MPQQRVDVPGPYEPQRAGGEVRLGVGAGGEAVGVEFVQEERGAGHDGGGRVALGGVRAQDDPQLAHDGGGVGVVALYVADDRADAAAGQLDDVVPVAADVPAEPCGAVAHRELRAGHGGDAARQHRLLEPFGQVVFLVEEHGAGQALRDAGAEGDEEGAFFRAEALLVAVEQAECADGAGLGDQRQIGGGGEFEGVDVLPELGVGGGEILAGPDEAGGEGPYDFAHGVVVGDPGVAGAGYEGVGGALGDEVDAAALDEADDEAVGAEALQAGGIAEDVDDVLHGSGVCEGGGGPFDDGALVAASGGGLAAFHRMGEFGGRVAEDAQDAVRAAVPVAADVALDVGPSGGVVAAPDAEVRPVGGAAGFEGPRHEPVERHGLGELDAVEEGGGVAVVLLGGEVEDGEGGGVQVHEPAVQVPVEGAHAVEGQRQVRVRGPVTRQRYGGRRRSPINHEPTLSPFARFAHVFGAWAAGTDPVGGTGRVAPVRARADRTRTDRPPRARPEASRPHAGPGGAARIGGRPRPGRPQ